MAKKDKFTTILETGKKRTFARIRHARDWYRGQTAKVQRNAIEIRPNKLLREALKKDRLKTNLKGKLMVGNMYMFRYDPKLKESLPYYDKFPLVIRAFMIFFYRYF